MRTRTGAATQRPIIHMTLRAAVIVLATLLFSPWAWPSAQPAEETLDVYFIDVEGGPSPSAPSA